MLLGDCIDLIRQVNVDHQGLYIFVPCDALQPVQRSAIHKIHGAEVVPHCVAEMLMLFCLRVQLWDFSEISRADLVSTTGTNLPVQQMAGSSYRLQSRDSVRGRAS